MFEKAKNFILEYGTGLATTSFFIASLYDFCNKNYGRAIGDFVIGLTLYKSVNYKIEKIDSCMAKKEKAVYGLKEALYEKEKAVDNFKRALDEKEKNLDRLEILLHEKDELLHDDDSEKELNEYEIN